MTLNKPFFPEFFPSIDRFSFKSSLVWQTQGEVKHKLPESLTNPLGIHYKYITHFRPERVGGQIPGLIGGTAFIHDGHWTYNVEKNSYHVRCIAEFIVANLFNMPPLSPKVQQYSLEIGFALVDNTEVLIFTPPIHFNLNIKKSTIIWHIRRKISIFLHSYKDPRVIRGISLYVVYGITKKKKRGRRYWSLKEVTVDQVLETFGVTPPVFRGYRLGRDGKLIIPPKPPKDYTVQVPDGKKPFTVYRFKFHRWFCRKRRKFLRKKLKEYKHLLQIRTLLKTKYRDPQKYKVKKEVKERRRRRRRNRKLSKQIRDNRKVQDKKRRILGQKIREEKRLRDKKNKKSTRVAKINVNIVLSISTLFIVIKLISYYIFL